MNILVFNNALEMVGLVESYHSLIWRNNYYKIGFFELHVTLPEKTNEVNELLNLLKVGNLIVKDDKLDEAGIIESISLKDNETETLTVTGYLLNGLLKHRIIWGIQTFNGNVENAMRYYVSTNCINPTNVNRIIPHLYSGELNNVNQQISDIVSYKNLAEHIEELSIKFDIGWKVNFDIEQKRFEFVVYKGRDLSILQNLNPQCVFSLEYENVLDQEYSFSNTFYKNTALVAGEGEGVNRDVIYINNNNSGFDRREMYVDARDLQKEQDGQMLNTKEYENLLLERGLLKLSENQQIKTFQSGIILNSNLKLNEDFYLGDIVTIQNERWKVTLNTRITEIEEVYENNIKDVKVNFGNTIPTLMDRIKQRTR